MASLQTFPIKNEVRNSAMIERGCSLRARPFLFSKIPRTASESMNDLFRANLLDYIKVSTPKKVAEFYKSCALTDISVSHGHTPVGALIACGQMPPIEFVRRFSFTFIRNPWSRIVSVFNLMDHYSRNLDRKSIATGCNNVNDFIQRLRDKNLTSKSPTELGFEFYSPQWSWVFPRMTFIGRYESLMDDWKLINESLGIDIKFTRHNRQYGTTVTPPGVEALSSESIEIIRALYSDDCYLGGYSDMSSKCPLSSDQVKSRAKEIWKSHGVLLQ